MAGNWAVLNASSAKLKRQDIGGFKAVTVADGGGNASDPT
ncbi:MAG: hypothetical protein ACJAWG_002990 [Candidatus Azotimanducaceae bacterium]|jgi:hypothetical protein